MEGVIQYGKKNWPELYPINKPHPYPVFPPLHHLLRPSCTSTCPRYLTKNILEKLIFCRPEGDAPTVNLSGCSGEGRLVDCGDCGVPFSPPTFPSTASLPPFSISIGF